MEQLAASIKVGEATNQMLYVLFMNVDRFQEVNDAHGHAVGDIFLQEVAQRFISNLPPDHIAARIGGDEFAVILPNFSPDALRRLGDDLLCAFREPLEVAGRKIEQSISIGLLSHPAKGAEPEQLLKYAEIAMRAAKAQRCGLLEFNPAMARALARKQTLKRRFLQALQNEDAYLAYQPFVAISTGRLTGAEVLFRWTDPELGTISPGEIIPIVQEHHLMPQLGDWIVHRACRQLQEWTRAGLPAPGRLSMNVAVEQIENGAIIDTITAAVAAYDVDPNQLAVEITEDSMMGDTAQTLKVLAALKELGVAVSIDDFGTGYSSLSYLKQFAVDKLKIDISFIRDLLEDEASEQIVTATIAMARGLGLDVLAEGIETREQAERVVQLGCLEAQGFLYEKPLSADEFAQKWLASIKTPLAAS